MINKPPHLVPRSPSLPPSQKSTPKLKAPSRSKKQVSLTASSDESDSKNASVDPASPNLFDPQFLSLIHFHQHLVIRGHVVTSFGGPEMNILLQKLEV